MEEGRALYLDENTLSCIKREQNLKQAHKINKRRLFQKSLKPLEIELSKQVFSLLSAQFLHSKKSVLTHAAIVRYLQAHSNRVGRYTPKQQLEGAVDGLTVLFDWIEYDRSGKAKLVRFDPPDGQQTCDYWKLIEDPK